MYKTISAYPNYGVDESGNVKNLKTGRILKPNNHKGYKYVKLYSADRNRTVLVHRLVAEAFLLNPSQLPEVNHKDENTANNCVENLEWCTSKYNANYGHHIEHCQNTLKNSGKSWFGKKHSAESKKKMSDAKLGKASKRKKTVVIDGCIEISSLTECAEFLHISLTQVFNVIHGNRKLSNHSISYKEVA